MRTLLSVFSVVVCFTACAAADDLVVEDFEKSAYAPWTITGKAFGDAPARGTMPNQLPVSGFRGMGLVNTFAGGDASTGTATSPEFTIERSHLAFLIGGGADAESVGMRLLKNDEVVRLVSGSESEVLEWGSWDVSDLRGATVRLQIFDTATGGWGHINVDHIVQTDSPPDKLAPKEKLTRYRSQPDYMNELFRPQFHFSPEINWMNDPNGLVYHEGEYHLFYQHNPYGNSWGHMSWGHAVSTDLLHWKHLPLAIPEEDGIMAFSGCCVVDHRNSSGFGKDGRPPMVAIYTGHGDGRQAQYLAYSNDNGRDWVRYSGNPVLDLGKQDFRDPRVFWHKPSNRWIMVVSLAAEKVLVFYGSSDLKNWTELSRFGPAGVTDKPNWECPDLFELDVENESGRKLWVLEVDIGNGSVAGGSGGEYFVGTFDGTRFQTLQRAQWVDFGRDFYAPISWDNIPQTDGRRIWLGWFNNWETHLVPTSPWRSCMSVPRRLSLKKTAFNREEPATYVLVQRPVAELDSLRIDSQSLNSDKAAWPPVALTAEGDLDDLTFELEATLQPGIERSAGFRIRTAKDEFLEVGYDRHFAGVYVDRNKSGNVSFHDSFAGRHTAPARLIDGSIELRIIVDRSTIEVFINDGESVISDRFFPTTRQPVIEAFVGGPSAQIVDVILHRQKSVWNRD